MSVETPKALLAAASGDAPSSNAAGSIRARATARAANWALYWTVAFIALHAYWYLGGRVGFGDQVDPLPGAPSSLGDWIFSVVVWGMFAAGLAVPSALARPWGRRLARRLLVWSMWIGCLVLVARGGSGLLDDGLRFTDLVGGGLTGLSTPRRSVPRTRRSTRSGRPSPSTRSSSPAGSSSGMRHGWPAIRGAIDAVATRSSTTGPEGASTDTRRSRWHAGFDATGRLGGQVLRDRLGRFASA